MFCFLLLSDIPFGFIWGGVVCYLFFSFQKLVKTPPPPRPHWQCLSFIQGNLCLCWWLLAYLEIQTFQDSSLGKRGKAFLSLRGSTDGLLSGKLAGRVQALLSSFLKTMGRLVDIPSSSLGFGLQEE